MNKGNPEGSGVRLPLFGFSAEILLSPVNAVDKILQRRRASVKVIPVLLALFAGLWSYYYYSVDFVWFLDNMSAERMAGMEESERGAVREGFQQLSPGMMFSITMITGGISILFIVFLRGIYLSIVSKILSAESPSAVSWVALSIWATIPTIISTLFSIVYVLTEDISNKMPSDITLTSANRLIFRLPPSSGWATMVQTFDLLLLWSFMIMGIGFSRWVGASYFLGQVVSFLPLVLIYGIWAAIIHF